MGLEVLSQKNTPARRRALPGRSLATTLTFVLALSSAPVRAGNVNVCDGVLPVGGDDLVFELVQNGLTRPLFVTSPPGDTERIFIVEQRGVIRVKNLVTGALSTFLDIDTRVTDSSNEQGLLGLAFHPDHAANGWFFVNYSREGAASVRGDTRISRFSVLADDPDRADTGSELVLLDVAQPASNHNGGCLAFGPDGYLYCGLGDGGSSCDTAAFSGQAGAQLLGKMLRLDVDDGAYAIPADNPFLDNAGVRDEIWALGLRNPWRFSFDSLTGDLYIGDVGQGRWEEISFVPGGTNGGYNYEWNNQEGNHSSTGSGCSPRPFGPGQRVGAIFEYRFSGPPGCSVTGGVVYRGCKLPDIEGLYFFSDYCSSWIRSIRVVESEPGVFVATEERDWTSQLNAAIPGNANEITSFGTDGRGEIYVCDRGGQVYRITATEPPPPTNPPEVVLVTDPDPAEVSILDGTPATVLLDATASTDGDENIEQELSFAWSQTEGPVDAEIARPTKESTVVTFDTPGEYVFSVTVTDPDGSTSATVGVRVDEVHGDVFFRRGDVNGDLTMDISDGVATLLGLFGGGEIRCEDAADANDSGTVDISDAVFDFNFLFLGGATPPAPGPQDCGADPSDDDLDCADTSSCS